MLCKCYGTVLYIVHVTAFSLGGRFFRDTVYIGDSIGVFQSLVAALVLRRLDYGNDTLVGLRVNLVRRLQSVQNAAARLVGLFRLRRSDPITDALVSHHWLRVPERIIFKIALRTYRALHGDATR